MYGSGNNLILSLSQMLAEKCEWLFASRRNYTYQIYLLHMFPIRGGDTCIKLICLRMKIFGLLAAG